jgi:UDP-N-acetyl-2-amino-2-deoxyglucuronate dehydrogenase
VTLHVGFTGGGNITDTHIRAVLDVPGLVPVAIHGRNADRVAALASRYDLAVAPTLEDLLARDIGLLCLGSPSGVHADEIAAAATRRCHVLTEKPLDISLERCDAALEAAENAGIAVGLFFQDRCTPAFRDLKVALDAGRLGTPLLVEARVKWYREPSYYAGSRWRGTWALDGGGALMNQGIHTVDLLVWLLGDVSRVSARAATLVHDIEVEDTVVATLEFANGAVGTLLATTAAYPGYPRRLEITGTEGTVLVEQDRVARWDLKSGVETPDTAGAGNASGTTAVVADASPHRRVMEDFVEALRVGRPPACSGREGRRSVAVVSAIYESARRGTPVDVDAVPTP